MPHTLSPALQGLLQKTEDLLGTEVVLSRQQDAPANGILLDSFSYDTRKNIIVFPSGYLGLLKEVVIARNCAMLLLKGIAAGNKEFHVLSFDETAVAKGVTQIYLDILKDEKTRDIPVQKKKKLAFFLYFLVHETLTDVPGGMLADIYVFRHLPVMRNALVYLLVKESLNDMHSLVAFKYNIPQRYFVLHNAMYYTRDLYYAASMSSVPLNPMVNIPEMQKFKNLDLKEMMTHRWKRSPWYHTKIIGDFLYRNLMQVMDGPPEKMENPRAFFQLRTEITNGWTQLLQLKGWYPWEEPAHLQKALKCQPEIEDRVGRQIFS